jgi:hypothetical protein
VVARSYARQAQARIASLRGLAACYSCNLHAPTDPSRFRPLPIGALPGGSSPAAGEAALRRAAAAAPPWAARDARLLVTPMRLTSRARRLYLATLSSPAYSELVHVVNERLPPTEFLDLLATHRAVLSPPGHVTRTRTRTRTRARARARARALTLTRRGLDCFRTWQALALGSVPLVPRDQAFDPRLHELGPAAIPPPAELTVEGLRALLDGLRPPAQGAVDLSYWEAEWEGHLAAAAEAALPNSSPER